MAVYVLMLWLTSAGRACDLLSSAACRVAAWNYIGDAIWLRNLYHWQTLFTGLLALVAALVAAFAVYRQIQMEEERRRRVQASVRAMLLHTMSNLLEYIEDCARHLLFLRRSCVGDLLPAGVTPPAYPATPMEAITQLERMIEVSDKATALPFSSIMAELQLFDARVRYGAGRNDNAINIENNIIKAAEIYARASMLFPFLRSETEDLPTPGRNAGYYMTALRLLDVHDGEFGRIYQTMAQRIVRVVGAPAT